MNTDDGGPAFPYSALLPDKESRQLAGTMYADNEGMSLRDYFAGQALIAVTIADSISRLQADADGGTEDERTGVRCETAAEYAYNQADAMIAERAK